MGPALKSGLSMAMAAAGTRGELIGAGGRSGFRLAFKADALWVGTLSDEVNGPMGRLAGTHAAVTRFRTGLEGSRGFSFGSGLSLVPGVEVGLRHDGGDAERGSGVDIGGELLVSRPAMGLSAEVRMRTLLVHEAEGFRDRGVSVSLSFDPMPSTPLGFKARVEPSRVPPRRHGSTRRPLRSFTARTASTRASGESGEKRTTTPSERISTAAKSTSSAPLRGAGRDPTSSRASMS